MTRLMAYSAVLSIVSMGLMAGSVDANLSSGFQQKKKFDPAQMDNSVHFNNDPVVRPMVTAEEQKKLQEKKDPAKAPGLMHEPLSKNVVKPWEITSMNPHSPAMGSAPVSQ